MEERIRSALPYLEEETFVQIEQHLAVLGVRESEDLELLNTSDFSPVLSVVDSRRLLLAFKKGNVYIFAF